MSDKCLFNSITAEKRIMIETMIIDDVNGLYRKETVIGEAFEFVFDIYDSQYKTYMSYADMKISVGLTIDIIEELKNINNKGLVKKEFCKILDDIDKMSNESMRLMEMWNRIATDTLNRLIYELDCVRRVGGAWAFFIANLEVHSAILAIYNSIVDSFDDEELYIQSVFFLLKYVMKMRSKECKIEENAEG